MPPTDRQRVESAIRYASTVVTMKMEASRTLSWYAGSPQWRIGARWDASLWLRFVRALEAVPLDSPRCVELARAALTVYRADRGSREPALSTLRALRGYSPYYLAVPRLRRGRIPG